MQGINGEALCLKKRRKIRRFFILRGVRFRFAVKKKTFADLGVELKKGFTAMGNFFKNLGAKIKELFTKKK